MVHIVHRAHGRSGGGRDRTIVARRHVFDETGTWIGTVNSGGAVLDADGVQVGVEWPNGEIVDFGGVQIGHL